jgi:predicted patatin/cPLA2 family phospholipase
MPQVYTPGQRGEPIHNVALVLEGGSLRTLYTSGVLDVFMENEIEFGCIIGVSAGALNGANYIANHIGRSARINIMHSNDSNYYGIRQFLFKGSIFNFNYLFYSPIKDIYPYNENALINSKQKFIICATDCETVKAVYFEKHNYNELVQALQASSSVPLICKPVNVDGIVCLDGGLTDPVCVHKAFSEGYEKVVVVLTRAYNQRRRNIPAPIRVLIKMFYKKYPKLIAALNNFPNQYNSKIEEINKMEQEGKIFVIRPSRKINIRGIEKDARKLVDLYLQGRADARKLLPQMSEYINKEEAL